ncbi:hypothetical protein O988_09009 [Pseudogymnoascus sp. VKM F-3808]|nr:hypothetical protein O988_09009 [Pseudogymnoascus sp. VKM F-3808]
MPIFGAFVPDIIEVLLIVGLGAPTIGGAIRTLCTEIPSPFCSGKTTRSTIYMGKRDIIDLSDIPKLNVERRADVGPCNIPKYNFDICHDQVKAQTIQVVSSIPSPGVGRFDNIPPACMNLASVLGGSCTGEGPRPTPCGSACIQYTGLSDKQMYYLSRALNAKP